MNVKNFMDMRLGTLVQQERVKIVELEKNLVRVDEEDEDLFERRDAGITFQSQRDKSSMKAKMNRFNEIYKEG